MKIPAYTEELHLKLTKLLDQIDPASIANVDPMEYYPIAGYALCDDTSLDLITAINVALTALIDEKYILTETGINTIYENI